MRKVQELTKQELRKIVQQLQEFLYLDTDPTGKSFWNPNKQRRIDYLEYLADSLAEHSLVPKEIKRIG